MGLINEIKRINPEEKGLHVMTDDELHKLKQILLEMALFIKNTCEENNIEWGLCGGSALGAIRHKGFIPWDDDLDICMTRVNFEKLKSFFLSSDTGKYKLQIPGDKSYFYHFPRIIDTTKSLIDIRAIDKGFVFVDIFIIEDMYDNKVRRFLHGIECTCYLLAISSMLTHMTKENLIKYGTSKLIKMIKLRDAFSIFFRSKTIEEWIAEADKVFSKANNPKSEFVCIPSGGAHYFGEIYSRAGICTFKYADFEDLKLPVPVDSDEYLRTRYGDDYMTPPDKNNQEKHVIVSCSL